jgi:hypothetical protein
MGIFFVSRSDVQRSLSIKAKIFPEPFQNGFRLPR